ncbi:MAG: hypothetical protein FWE66_04805, partial [Oscillospiraceae bacterium]|nr:hypothetical protein [Oscillospiraceae bacterium]
VGGYTAVKEQKKGPDEPKTERQAERKKDSLVLSKSRERADADRVHEARNEVRRNVAAFRAMAEVLFKAQSQNYTGKLKDDIQSIIGKVDIDDSDLSFDSDPEWGVEAVADRILSFAKALANGDETKIEMLRQAVKKGYEMAEKAWGGSLPGISGRTLDRIMQGFDEWKKEFAGPGTAE